MTYRALLFLAAGCARGRVGFVVVAVGHDLGGAGDVLLLVVGLAPHLVCRLVELLVGGLQFCLAVTPAGEADLTSGVLELKQRRLLWHVRF